VRSITLVVALGFAPSVMGLACETSRADDAGGSEATGEGTATAGESGQSASTEAESEGSVSSGSGAPESSGDETTSSAVETFYVEGRFLYDGCGEQVVLRGVNEMVVWSPGQDGLPEFEEIARTGANAVRIVWNEEGTAAELDEAIQNAIDNALIPMVEHHSATGDLSLIPTVVDYWTSEEVIAVLHKHARVLLLNIANEAGDDGVEASEFQSTYETAITRIRDTGLTVPLIIDASTWGQDIDMLQEVGPQLSAFDPLHNLMFSVHMWWNDPSGARVRDELEESVSLELPLIVGEFADHAVYLCDESPFDYGTLLEEAERLEIGWFAWSWGGVDNADCADAGPFDMTVDGVFGEWETDWGREVAVDHAQSIQNTSVRPSAITDASCG